MSDFLSKALLSGLGLASLTKDAVRQMGKDLSKRAKLSESEGRRLVKDLERRSSQAQKALHKQVEGVVHKVVKSLNLATMDDVHRARKGRGAKSAARKRSASSKRRKVSRPAPDAPDSTV